MVSAVLVIGVVNASYSGVVVGSPRLGVVVGSPRSGVVVDSYPGVVNIVLNRDSKRACMDVSCALCLVSNASNWDCL